MIDTTTIYRPRSQAYGTCKKGDLQIPHEEPCVHRCREGNCPDEHGNCSGHKQAGGKQNRR